MTVLCCTAQLQTATKALLDELGVPSSDTPEDRPERVCDLSQFVFHPGSAASCAPSRGWMVVAGCLL